MAHDYLKRVVDNRVFLLGLDQHYRDAMKLFEAKTLLPCAAAVAQRLALHEAPVPLEGYYGDPSIPELARYFRLMRALQQVPGKQAAPARDMPELGRIIEIAASAMYGRAQYPEEDGERRLLPVGRDPLSEALRNLLAFEWGVERLLRDACAAALQHDDISLVGLAARARDAVVLAALRESVVLYAEKVDTIGAVDVEYEYEWRVDAGLERAADRFIELFNRLVAGANGSQPHDVWLGGPFERRATQPIPRATARNAEHFYGCAQDNDIIGRCVHLGTRIDTQERYHWAVRYSPARRELEVHDFWSDETWTSERYRAQPPRA